MTERDGQPGQPFPARTSSRLSRDAIEHPLATHIAAVRSLGIASSIVPARVSRSRAGTRCGSSRAFPRLARWSPRIMATRRTKASQSHLDQLLHTPLWWTLTPMASYTPRRITRARAATMFFHHLANRVHG
jgi:hypothetical protein